MSLIYRKEKNPFQKENGFFYRIILVEIYFIVRCPHEGEVMSYDVGMLLC